MTDFPEPPYYAVIFISKLGEDTQGYEAMAERIVELARSQPGFLGLESARNEVGITVSFWRDRESIRKWRDQADHRMARQLGRDKWYRSYDIHIARVETHRQLHR